MLAQQRVVYTEEAAERRAVLLLAHLPAGHHPLPVKPARVDRRTQLEQDPVAREAAGERLARQATVVGACLHACVDVPHRPEVDHPVIAPDDRKELVDQDVGHHGRGQREHQAGPAPSALRDLRLDGLDRSKALGERNLDRVHGPQPLRYGQQALRPDEHHRLAPQRSDQASQLAARARVVEHVGVEPLRRAVAPQEWLEAVALAPQRERLQPV